MDVLGSSHARVHIRSGGSPCLAATMRRSGMRPQDLPGNLRHNNVETTAGHQVEATASGTTGTLVTQLRTRAAPPATSSPGQLFPGPFSPLQSGYGSHRSGQPRTRRRSSLVEPAPVLQRTPDPSAFDSDDEVDASSAKHDEAQAPRVTISVNRGRVESFSALEDLAGARRGSPGGSLWDEESPKHDLVHALVNTRPLRHSNRTPRVLRQERSVPANVTRRARRMQMVEAARANGTHYRAEQARRLHRRAAASNPTLRRHSGSGSRVHTKSPTASRPPKRSSTPSGINGLSTSYVGACTPCLFMAVHGLLVITGVLCCCLTGLWCRLGQPLWDLSGNRTAKEPAPWCCNSGCPVCAARKQSSPPVFWN